MSLKFTKPRDEPQRQTVKLKVSPGVQIKEGRSYTFTIRCDSNGVANVVAAQEVYIPKQKLV